MQSISYKGFSPEYNKTNFIAPGAIVVGRVKMGEFSNIWFNTVIRGDVNKIEIGKNVNIQDLSMIHITEEFTTIIEDNVTIGHSAIIHGAKIGKGSLIGMGAKVLDGVEIGEESLVAAGSVVAPGKKFPPRSFIIGTPAKVKRSLTNKEVAEYSNHYKSYVELAKTYL